MGTLLMWAQFVALGFGLKWKEGTNMEDDLYDIPVAYLLYVLLAIVVLMAGAAVAIVML
jgi:hypothetical protein